MSHLENEYTELRQILVHDWIQNSLLFSSGETRLKARQRGAGADEKMLHHLDRCDAALRLAANLVEAYSPKQLVLCGQLYDGLDEVKRTRLADLLHTQYLATSEMPRLQVELVASVRRLKNALLQSIELGEKCRLPVTQPGSSEEAYVRHWDEAVIPLGAELERVMLEIPKRIRIPEVAFES